MKLLQRDVLTVLPQHENVRCARLDAAQAHVFALSICNKIAGIAPLDMPLDRLRCHIEPRRRQTSLGIPNNRDRSKAALRSLWQLCPITLFPGRSASSSGSILS